MRVALVYDMDACRGPTGVTRHALAQIEQLARRPEIGLQLVSGRITEPDGLARWETWAEVARRHELPARTRDLLRLWRLVRFPPLDLWTGRVDWLYSPAEYPLVSRRARKAVTSHDVLQDIQYGGPRRRALLAKVFDAADLILSVSAFNTARLLEAFPNAAGKVEYVPNGAEDLFFEPVSEHERERERASVRAGLGLRPGQPYLLSVANFQPRKNLERLVRVVGRLIEAKSGELALVLVGTGSEEQSRRLNAAVGESRCRILMPGYREGKALRALYAKAEALVFPSRCESFGIPAIEAMAQGCPVALADSTALPEVAGAAGWYFDPESDDELETALRHILDQKEERVRRVALGRSVAEGFRWRASNDRLVAALRQRAV